MGKIVVYYIGESGGLNTRISSLLNEKYLDENGIDFRIVSGRKPEPFNRPIGSKLVVIFGARSVTGWLGYMAQLDESDAVVFLNTYIYNDFYDSYQLGKTVDFNRLSQCNMEMQGFSLDLPFIVELMPDNVGRLQARKSGCSHGYFLYTVSLSCIESSLCDLIKGLGKVLEITPVPLVLSLKERILWNLFSSLYAVVPRFRDKKVTMFFLNVIKFFEKSLHKMTFSHGLSAVFISRLSVPDK